MESTNERRISKNFLSRNDRIFPLLRRVSAAVSLVGSMAAHADGLTISGLVGAGPTYTSDIAGGARYAVDTAPNRPNYLAFNGSESLGANTSAYFRLSGRFLADAGLLVGQLFNANSIVGSFAKLDATVRDRSFYSWLPDQRPDCRDQCRFSFSISDIGSGRGCRLGE
ncbi:hypothetical protein [Cupriavidus oxalaticus]|uniref:hypothetical protein n=1 Tax=Cupriavidus oxalaticus TaxID=96344 RepID=UPI00316E0F8E